MSFTKYKEWHEDFTNKYKSKSEKKTGSYGEIINYSPFNLNGWYDEVEENHKEIRKILGGVRKNVNIETSSETPAPYHEVVTHIADILKIIPDYFTAYNLYADLLCYSKLQSQNGISTAKHILGYGKRIKLSENETKELSDHVSKLAKIWNSYDSKKTKLAVTFTTDPKAFTLMGNYGIDKGSCFTQGSFNGDKKYTFGAHSNSFVILMRDKVEEDQVEVEKDLSVRSRALGIMSKNGIINTSNTNGYVLAEPIYRSALENASKEIFKFDKPATSQKGITYKGGMNYISHYIYSVYDKKEHKDIDAQSITFDTKYSKESHPEKQDEYATW